MMGVLIRNENDGCKESDADAVSDDGDGSGGGRHNKEPSTGALKVGRRRLAKSGAGNKKGKGNVDEEEELGGGGLRRTAPSPLPPLLLQPLPPPLPLLPLLKHRCQQWQQHGVAACGGAWKQQQLTEECHC